MQYNSQRYNNPHVAEDTDGEIEQYFGNGNMFEQQKVAGGKKYEPQVRLPKKEPFELLSKIEAIPLQKKNGYMSFLILLGLSLFILMYFMAWGQIVATLLIAVVTFLIWKHISFEMPSNFMHYLSNATVTWKALLRQIPLIKQALPYSKHILFWSVISLTIQSLLFELVLPSFITNIIYSTSFFSVFIGVALCFGNREFAFINQALSLYGYVLMLELLMYVFMNAYMHVFGAFSFLFIWTLASFNKEWSTIEETERKSEKTDVVAGQTD